jgi:hypothetical protein
MAAPNIFTLLLGVSIITGAIPETASARDLPIPEGIEALPAMKAYAYALAIDEYCFPNQPMASGELWRIAWWQEAVISGTPAGEPFIHGLKELHGHRMEGLIEKAAKHLRGDQSACGPAISFVTRTKNDFPALESQLLNAIFERNRMEVVAEESRSPQQQLEPKLRPNGPAKAEPLLTDFLASRTSDDCLLALPTGPGSKQSSMKAFALVPEAVNRLGAEYQRLSGVQLKAEMQAVSKAQCGALAFGRSLSQYPNFPLRIKLAESTIQRGYDLSGAVSGLHKDTLYLIVVDDEGRAELVTSFKDQRAPLTHFSAPMTLPPRPASAVQLLVAIASDGPLRTVPLTPGVPTEEYFSKLATEIITGNRSIAYGITSFTVK